MCIINRLKYYAFRGILCLRYTMCPHAGASGLFVLLVFSSKDLNTTTVQSLPTNQSLYQTVGGAHTPIGLKPTYVVNIMSGI